MYLALSHKPSRRTQPFAPRPAAMGKKKAPALAPAFAAADEDDATALEMLVDADASIIASRNPDGWTPLHAASFAVQMPPTFERYQRTPGRRSNTGCQASCSWSAFGAVAAGSGLELGAYLGVRYSVRPFEQRSDTRAIPGTA